MRPFSETYFTASAYQLPAGTSVNEEPVVGLSSFGLLGVVGFDGVGGVGVGGFGRSDENRDLMQYCECTNDFVNAIINDYFKSFEIRKYYIDEYEQPYYGVLSYLYDIGYTVEYELLQEAHLQDSFDTATGSVDVKEFAEDGVIHVYSNETGKDVAQIPLTKLSELEKEIKDFVEYKLSTYKVANPTKRSDLLPKSIYAFDIPNEIARVKRYKEYAEYCLKQLEQMQKEG